MISIQFLQRAVNAVESSILLIAAVYNLDEVFCKRDLSQVTIHKFPPEVFSLV